MTAQELSTLHMTPGTANEILKCCCHHNRCLDDSLKFTKVNAMQKLFFFFNQEHTTTNTEVMAEGCIFRVAAYKLAQYI